MEFEKIYEQLQPMISAHMRKLHIYKNKEHFRQIANVAIWLAWEKYDPQRGDFEPYASQTIRGALLSELTKSSIYEERYIPMEDQIVTAWIERIEEQQQLESLERALETLTVEERDLLINYYYEGYTHKEMAEKRGITLAALQKRKLRLLVKLKEMNFLES